MTKIEEVRRAFLGMTGDGDIERLRGPGRAVDRQRLMNLYFKVSTITKSNSGINRLYEILPSVYGIAKGDHCQASLRTLIKERTTVYVDGKGES